MSLETTYLNKFCKNLESLGWKQKEPQKLDNYLIKEIFDKKIEELNKKVFDLYPGQKEKIFANLYLELQHADEVKILEFLRFGVTIVIKNWNTSIPLTLKLIDYENIQNNSFYYIREQEVKYGNKINRPDVLLFVNGIPLIVIEGKNPIKLDISNPYYEALRQIRRYQKEIRDLFKFVQFGVAAADQNPYMPTYPLNQIEEPSKYMFWKVNRKENIFDLLEPSKLLDVINNFIFFTKNEKGERTKIIARYMQYFAVKKAMKRITDYLENKEDKRQGLIWHWQGSGKTNTMFFTAYQFIKEYHQKNPLVFFVVDRLDLEEQMERVYRSIEHKRLTEVEKITSIGRLEEIIKNADKEWGLKIVTIQKFQEAKLNTEDIVNKREVLFLIDEAHRTQYGDLAANMRRIFQKAIFIGFTGTPVFTNERNTFKFFAYPPEELYLDEYFIEQSQQDGFTLPLTFRVINEGKKYVDGIQILLSEEDIKDLWDSALKEEESTNEDIEQLFDMEDMSKIKKQLREKIRKKKIILENEKRIEKVVEYIAKNIEEDTENWNFKTMIVASSRPACVRYKKFIDKYLPSEYSEVVMSYQQNEIEEIHAFKEEFLKRYNTKDEHEANKKVIEKFLKKENPRILIVTDMLITGFDAPILKVMYLDKIMFFHRLLQTVARVNRPYPKKGKNEGLIIDSAGVLSEVYRALSTYNYLAKENPEKIAQDLKHLFRTSNDEIKHLEENIIYLKDKLMIYGIDLEDIVNQLRNNKLDFFDPLSDVISDLALRKDDENIIKLFRFIKETLEIYKSLGADPKKIEYKKYIDALSIIYKRFIKTINKGRSKNYSKVLDLLIDWINKNTLVEDMEVKFERKITKIKLKRPGISEAAATFYEIRNKTIDKLHNPLYREIYERIERLRKQWIERNMNIDEFLKQLEEENKKVRRLEEIQKMPIDERIENLIQKYLQKEALQKIDLTHLKLKIKGIVDSKRFLGYQQKDIKMTIAKIIIKSSIPREKKKEIIETMTNLVIESLREEICEKE